MSILKSLFGDENSRFIKKYNPIVDKINVLESDLKILKDDDFISKTNDLRERLKSGESLDDLLPEAFALVRESAYRSLNQRHYDVQLIGGIALHMGYISEMRTGEGKTLVAT